MYCSAQPQGVSLPSFEKWAPKDLQTDEYAPKLPEEFWKKFGPTPGVVDGEEGEGKGERGRARARGGGGEKEVVCMSIWRVWRR